MFCYDVNNCKMTGKVNSQVLLVLFIVINLYLSNFPKEIRVEKGYGMASSCNTEYPMPCIIYHADKQVTFFSAFFCSSKLVYYYNIASLHVVRPVDTCLNFIIICHSNSHMNEMNPFFVFCNSSVLLSVVPCYLLEV